MAAVAFWISVGLAGALCSRALHRWADRRLAAMEAESEEEVTPTVIPFPVRARPPMAQQPTHPMAAPRKLHPRRQPFA